MSRLLTLAQAARRIGVSQRTLQAMVRAGEFPHPVRRNARWLRVPLQDVVEYLDRLEQNRQVQTT